MSRKGSIPVTPSMSLFYVLHVPNLANNFLFVAQILLFFQDLVTGKMIGNGRMKDGLDFLVSQLKQPG
jgi:hypothetical protein